MDDDAEHQTNLLELTLAAAKQDEETVREGAPVAKMLDGLVFHESIAHRDDRGSLTELFDPRWTWHPKPFAFCHQIIIHPGAVKGWGLHKIQEDRYFVVEGEMEVVMYDPRSESSTCGQICRVILAADRPRLMNVPTYVWHAAHNIGTGICRVINFPTIAYDPKNPDKYRLPLDTPLIPFSFRNATGW
jgi:dTDP-4-dehydrorhamnose 3,5-epimerase